MLLCKWCCWDVLLRMYVNSVAGFCCYVNGVAGMCYYVSLCSLAVPLVALILYLYPPTMYYFADYCSPAWQLYIQEVH